MYRRVIIVQARMTSKRLPGKPLAELSGRPMLAQQIRRLRACRTADDIVVATTVNATDDALVDLARREGVGWARGSEHDVLSRYVAAARESRADVVVRITADCPLIDPEVTDRVVDALTEGSDCCDYASNVLPRTFPRGLDVEALFVDVLGRICRLATTPESREHVTVLPRAGPHSGLFLTRSITDVRDNSDLRWTVDTGPDLAVARVLYQALGLADRLVPYSEILAYARAHPELARLNSGAETWTPAQ